LLQRTFWGAALVTGAVLAPVQAASAMPVNDLRSKPTKIFTRDPSYVGVRLIAEKVGQPGALINPELPLTGTPNDDGDPPLVQPMPDPHLLQASSTCPDRGVVQAQPQSQSLYPTRTVWYELTQDSAGNPFEESFLVTVDSAATNFPSSLAVYEGVAPPGPFLAGVSEIPKNIVACDTNLTNGILPSLVSFVTKPGKRYYLEAGVAPTLSGGSSLRLAMRVLDVSPPVVTVRLNDASTDVTKVFSYDILSNDPEAPHALPLLQQIRSGKAYAKLTPAGGACTTGRLQKLPGRYCSVEGANNTAHLLVHWLPLRSATKEFGRVTASYSDQAGNVGTNALQTQLKDLTPPDIVGKPSVRWTRRGRLFVSTRCKAAPGRIRVEVTTGGDPVKAGADHFYSRRGRTMVLRTAFQKVKRKSLFVHIVCLDQSLNKDERWLFLPR